jgi:hypothetical protein
MQLSIAVAAGVLVVTTIMGLIGYLIDRGASGRS